MAAVQSQPADTINVVTAAAAVSGVPFMVGTMLVVPIVSDATVGHTVACARTGAFLLEKVDGGGSAWTAGAKLYWDVVNLAVTYTDNTAANPRIGTAMAAAADAAVLGWVILGQF